MKMDERLATLKLEGQTSGRTTLTGRIVLERYNLAETDPDLKSIDELLIKHFRRVESFMHPRRPAQSA
jgi:3-hydroxyacyl-[acyl-carrier-protein] dehydratase